MSVQPAMTHDEKCVGRQADYLAYYRSARGKLYYQAIYASNLADAKAWIESAVRGCKVVRIVVRNPGAEV